MRFLFLLAAAAAVPTFWTGTIDGHAARWTGRDITVGGVSLGDRLQAAIVPTKDFDDQTEVELNGRLASAVGPYVSLSWDNYWSAPHAAHPGGTGGFWVIDLRHPKRPPRLDELFPARAIRDALVADPLVRDALREANAKAAPDLATFLKDSAYMSLVVTNPKDENEVHSCDMGEDVLTRFAFHHLEGNRVAVRLSVASNAGADRYYWTQLGLLLPVPPKLAPWLASAAAHHLLLRDFDAIPDKQTMHRAFTTP